MASLHGISSISATFYPRNLGKGLQKRCRYTHLTNKSIQEELALLVTVGMPFKGVDLTEGMEFLST
jgi:hypothetical protein